MKKYLFGATAVLAMGLVSTGVFAQQEENKIKIRIEKNVNGKTEVIEKEIDASEMSEAQRDAAIESFQDSLFNADGMKGKKVKIVIEDNQIHRLDRDEGTIIPDDKDDFHFDQGEGPRMHVYKKRQKGGDSDWDEFRWEMDRFGNEMRKLGEEMPRHFERTFPRVYAWTDDVLGEIGTSSIRSLEVFPNKPESDILNVRFVAPNEGDVTITVLDTKGKQVAQKEAKNFKGEYVGQLELKKAEKGTYFVIVSQGEDGLTRRVVVD